MSDLKVPKNIPLSIKAAKIIHDLIYDEYLEIGVIPSDVKLAKMMQVNRGTITQALKILEGMGLIYRIRGSGTYINKNVTQMQNRTIPQIRLDTNFEVTKLLKDSGYLAQINIVDVSKINSPDYLSELFKINKNELIVVIKKTIDVTDNPAIYFEEYIPYRFINKSINEVDFSINIFDIIESVCGKKITFGISNIIPADCDEEQKRLLQVQSSNTLIKLNSIYYDDENSPILNAVCLYNISLVNLNVLRRRYW